MPASGITVAEDQKQADKATAYTNQQGAALGKLRSFGDLMGDISVAQARDASLIGQIGGFKKGSSSILPYELEAANSAGSGPAALGDLLNAGGSVALAYGTSPKGPVVNRGSKSDKLSIGGSMSPTVTGYSLYPTGTKDQSRL